MRSASEPFDEPPGPKRWLHSCAYDLVLVRYPFACILSAVGRERGGERERGGGGERGKEVKRERKEMESGREAKGE